MNNFRMKKQQSRYTQLQQLATKQLDQNLDQQQPQVQKKQQKISTNMHLSFDAINAFQAVQGLEKDGNQNKNLVTQCSTLLSAYNKKGNHRRVRTHINEDFDQILRNLSAQNEENQRNEQQPQIQLIANVHQIYQQPYEENQSIEKSSQELQPNDKIIKMNQDLLNTWDTNINYQNQARKDFNSQAQENSKFQNESLKIPNDYRKSFQFSSEFGSQNFNDQYLEQSCQNPKNMSKIKIQSDLQAVKQQREQMRFNSDSLSINAANKEEDSTRNVRTNNNSKSYQNGQKLGKSRFLSFQQQENKQNPQQNISNQFNHENKSLEEISLINQIRKSYILQQQQGSLASTQASSQIYQNNNLALNQPDQLYNEYLSSNHVFVSQQLSDFPTQSQNQSLLQESAEKQQVRNHSKQNSTLSDQSQNSLSGNSINNNLSYQYALQSAKFYETNINKKKNMDDQESLEEQQQLTDIIHQLLKDAKVRQGQAQQNDNLQCIQNNSGFYNIQNRLAKSYLRHRANFQNLDKSQISPSCNTTHIQPNNSQFEQVTNFSPQSRNINAIIQSPPQPQIISRTQNYNNSQQTQQHFQSLINGQNFNGTFQKNFQPSLIFQSLDVSTMNIPIQSFQHFKTNLNNKQQPNFSPRENISQRITSTTRNVKKQNQIFKQKEKSIEQSQQHHPTTERHQRKNKNQLPTKRFKNLKNYLLGNSQDYDQIQNKIEAKELIQNNMKVLNQFNNFSMQSKKQLINTINSPKSTKSLNSYKRLTQTQDSTFMDSLEQNSKKFLQRSEKSQEHYLNYSQLPIQSTQFQQNLTISSFNDQISAPTSKDQAKISSKQQLKAVMQRLMKDQLEKQQQLISKKNIDKKPKEQSSTLNKSKINKELSKTRKPKQSLKM